MKFNIEITTDNAAFEDYEMEISRILNPVMRRLAEGWSDSENEMILRDINGNTVGRAWWTR